MSRSGPCEVGGGKGRCVVSLWVTLGYLRATIAHLRATKGHLMVTIGYLRVTIGYLRATICHMQVTEKCLFTVGQLKVSLLYF